MNFSLLSVGVVLVVSDLAPAGRGIGPKGACGAAIGSLCIFPDWASSGLGLGLSAFAVVLEDEDEVRDLSLYRNDISRRKAQT